VEPLHLGKAVYKTLQRNLLLFYTGNQRSASAILAEQKKNTAAPDKIEILSKMVELVWKLRGSLCGGDLKAFGGILHENWLLKKRLASGITNSNIDALYEKGISVGASGGKLLGAGGGGFLLFYCEPEKQPQLRAAFSGYTEMKFKFDNEGTKVIYAADEYLEH
jgi:D-glycero-alpha-D-manno-heptose-7-phosphate kinase